MDAVTLLHDHIDMYKLLEYYDFDKIRQDGSIIRSCCKIHGGNTDSAFVVNTKNNLYFCHTGGCGGGDAFTLVQKMEKVTFPEAVRIVAGIFNVNIEDMEIQERKASYMSEMKKWIKAMKGRKKEIIIAEYTIKEEVRKVAKFRDFARDTLEYFGLGHVASISLFTREGKPYTLKNRLVFPITQKGIRIGASLRRVNNADKPKWSHQPVNMETKELLYNYDATIGMDIITIVEGIPDVWAYHEIGVVAVATFGAHVTDEQYKQLMRTGAELVWSFDGDEAGRNALEKAFNLFKNKANQYVVDFAPTEDPASIPREELRTKYANKNRIG